MEDNVKEQLYTIPVNDAFATDCECPICEMYKELEKNAVEFTMGPSYMEDDVREVTDKMGFCTDHIKKLLKIENKLGISLVLHTHMVKTNKDIKQLAQDSGKPSTLFKKKDISQLTNYLHTVNNSCYVCDRIEETFKRYIRTIHYLWEKEDNFKKKYANSKGFCTKHYEVLLVEAKNNLSGANLDKFIEETNRIYLDNMQRVTDDLEWFIDKFDYKHKDDPWKNSKDALPRAVTKVNTREGCE
jgi:hypothetical protein